MCQKVYLLTYLLTYINSHNVNALLREKIQLQELYKNICKSQKYKSSNRLSNLQTIKSILCLSLNIFAIIWHSYHIKKQNYGHSHSNMISKIIYSLHFLLGPFLSLWQSLVLTNCHVQLTYVGNVLVKKTPSVT